MPHTPRLRVGWSTRVFRYRCRLPAPLPQAAWDTAKTMQALWNELVVLLHTCCPALHEASDEDVPVEERRALEKALWAKQGRGYCLVRDRGKVLGLSSNEKWHVRDRFEQAMKAWRKGHSEAPKEHHGLERLLLPYIPQQGGVAADAFLQKPRHPRFVFGAVEPPHHYRKATFTLHDGTPIPLLVLCHRPLPPQARLRQIALIGVFERSLRHGRFDGWEWHLHLTLELPPTAPTEARAATVAGVDFNWRGWQEGMRVAAIHDGAQAWEVLLPWDMSNRATKRRTALLARHGETLQTTGKWRALWDWQEQIDEALDTCKAHLAELATGGWPQAAVQLHARLDKLRAAGLRRLRRALWHAGVHLPVLDQWHEVHTLQMRRFRGTQLHLFRARNEWYRRVAVWLATHCDVVALEQIDLRGLATKGTDHRRARGRAGINSRMSEPERQLRRAQKNRQLAGVSVLRRYIVEACQKHHTRVIDVPAAGTSQVCAVCDARLVPGVDVWRLCPNGHIQDRDAASAIVIRRAALGTEDVATHAPLPVLLDNGRALVYALRDIEKGGLILPEIPAPGKTSTCGDTAHDDIPDVVVPAGVLASVAASA